MVFSIVNSYKSFWVGQHLVAEELPPLAVLTGRNGSGKSQLLQAMASGSIQSDHGLQFGVPRLITSVELQTIVDPRSYVPRPQHIQQLRQSALGYQGDPLGLGGYLATMGQLTGGQVSSAEQAAGRSMAFWSDADWDRFTPLENSGGDLFRFSIGALFTAYNQAETTNAFTTWRATRGDSSETYLSSEAFEQLHGEAPWLVLSRALETIGLPYFFEAPVASLAMDHVEPRMVDISTGRPASLDDLSSGEKTLLQIAMSMYSVERRLDSIAKPSSVLFDEPDAALHPSMVRSMLRLIEDELIGRLGLPVVLTTHSPTTVALAPESALFVVNRELQPRLTKVTTDQALAELLVGVPTVSVSSENRRLVVVEGPVDERVYSSAMEVLQGEINSERSLQFISAGGSSSADGCAAVIDLVSRLRTNGNVKVWGLVDRDLRVNEPDVHVFFDSARHSIENVILDPLSVGLLLLRDRDPQIMAAVAPLRFVSFAVEAAPAQLLVDAVTALVFPGSNEEALVADYLGGISLEVAASWHVERGHDLQERVVGAFPHLRKYTHNNRLLDEVVNGVWAERPEVVPKTTVQLFERLLTA
jgi:predicted ATPase